MRRGLLAAAAAQIGDFLLEPAERSEAGPSAAFVPASALVAEPRPVIAVVGLARRRGCTMVATALAAELAARDPEGAAAVAAQPRAGGISLAFPAARRLAGALGDIAGAKTSAAGRLCLVEGTDRALLAEAARGLAPLVIDAGTTELETELTAVADLVVLVTGPGVEPALVAAASNCVERLGEEAVTVLNRVASGAEPHGDSAGITLPESRMGAQLALGGRQAPGELGRSVGRLADLCAGPA